MTAPTMPPATPSASTTASRRPLGRGAASALRGAGSRVRSLGAGRRFRQPWLMGVLAALWAAAIGLAIAALPMLLVWMTTPSSGLSGAESLRIAGLLWVVAHGVPVTIGAVTYSLLPWGLVIVPALLLGYAGSWATRRSPISRLREVGALVLSGALVYALVAVGVVTLAARAGSSAAPVAAGAYAGTLAVLCLGWGALRAAGYSAGDLLPDWAVVMLRGGLIGAAALVGIGAFAALASLVAHIDDAITMTQALHPGILGGLGLLAVNVMYLPVLAVWGMSYVVGAGIVIGPGVTLSPFIAATTPTQLPPLPLLAALPQGASPLAWLLPVAGVAAGVLVGLAVSRGARQQPRLIRLALAAGSAAVAGIIVGLLALLGSGSLGDLRLAHLGPAPSAVALLAGVLLVLGAAPSAVVARPPARPRLTTLPSTDAPIAVVTDTDDPDTDLPDAHLPDTDAATQGGQPDV